MRSSSRRTIFAGSSLLVMAIAAAQPVRAQDTTISSSITTGSTWSGVTSPGSNFTVTSGGTINTAAPAAITVTGTVGALLGTLFNSGQILDTASSGRGISIGTVTVGAIENSGLVSSSSAIASTGTIGAISNTGTLSGRARGIYQSSSVGSIGSIFNSGLISAGTLAPNAAGGIANSGLIGTIVNTGTIISAQSSAIGNNLSTGSIGQLTNSGLLSGVTGGIWNQGTFGQIANTGRIIGLQAGIFQAAGTIGSLDNSGTISGGLYGISIGSGGLGSLVNNGLLSGPVALTIATGATIGGIANSGIIAGNIINSSANNLTITGGAGATVGTLTGNTLTNQGTITNTLSNLVFASGNLLLNDSINVTGRTVSNTGASLRLNSVVNVTGAFSQSAGSLVIDPATGGLIVSGAANITGGTVLGNLVSTGNYLAGTRTLVGGSSLNLTGATISINSITGLSQSTSTTASQLLLNINNNYVGGSLASLTNAGSVTSASTGLYVATTGSIGAVTNSGTLGGIQFGVNNRGTIGTLTNAGQITDNNFTALWNQGSIGNLVNTGTIINNSWAILNTGNLATLTNSGLISGTGNAIQNNDVMTLINNSGTMMGGSNALAGTFGTIVNSGVIRGDINKSGGIVGTIIGGSGGAVGTFTGFNGVAQGTIGASANLTFASGALLLNDTINAVGITASALTVSNTGADITLSTIVNINSNFRQTAGSLNLGSAGKLVVSQAASITGGTVTTAGSGLSSTSTYLKGDVGSTLVAGGAGSSYAGVAVSITGGFTGLAGASTISGNNLLLAVANDYVGDTQVSINNSATINGVNYPLYVANTGSIGTFTNSGSLVGLVDGANNNGSIGSLTNSGLISGAQKGLGNQATITNLVNTSTGTILGGTAAGLQNDTSLGTLTNAGFISSGSAGFANYGSLGSLINTGSISGGPQALYLTGTVGGVSNSGTITSGQTGILVDGTLNALTNSGFIGNTSNAVNVSGTLGTLMNAAGGTISGNNAVYVSGSLGGLANSGVIRGKIDNQSVNNLTITGGAGSTIGTLTGQSGAIGTINNTLSNLVFGSGNLLVNDRIIATGRTVSNTGANLSLANVISITGAYSQSAGTLNLIPGTSRLVVSGAANITGGTVAASLSSTGNYLVGAQTLVSGSSLNLTGATISLNSITGLSQSTSTTASQLLLNINNNYVGGSLASLTNSGSVTSANTGLYVATTGSVGTVTNTGTLGGGQFGVNNRGTIGTLTNAGRITNAAFTALWNQGSIGNLVNTGTIINNSWAILNSGNLATLTNSGLISGTGNAIQNNAVMTLINNSGTMMGGGNALAGTFGTIVNSGVIRGNINAFSGAVGTIIGGSGGAVGTFTGFNGVAQGTIGASSNLTFASGALLLNDTIKAAGITASALTVSNTGADITLSTIVNVDANFSQTAGSLNLGTAGKLVVSQAASITGGTVTTSLPSSANYLAGSAAGTLVQGGAGSSYSGVSVSANATPGLTMSAGTSGNNLVMLAANNYVGSNLASLTNSGSLTADYPVYVASGGSLGSLTNSGTLNGSIAAIYNAGTLGVIANTGVIAGNINNTSAQAITLTGGAGSTVGTLTGFGGGRGTINSTGGNVVFASGAMLLNDDIVATGHTVSNTGAGLTLANSASITGAYSQTAGALNLATGQQLIVSGAASITGGTVTTSVSSAGNYLAGSTAGTLVQGGAGSSYAGAMVSAGTTPGLTLNGGTSGNNLVVTAANNYVGSNLASLTNTGSLTADYPVYVASGGSLGSLTNSGTLSGSLAAIYNAGTLGMIANTGVIAGNINNTSAQAITLTGGAGSTIGTLTGFGGGMGTITSTGDLVFASGGLLLNDNIVATGHAVSNTGANLFLNNTVSITGDYLQSAGAINFIPGASSLVVSGMASISGGTVVTSLPVNANYLAGGGVGTLIQGGAGSSYAGVAFDIATTPGLALATSVSGNNLVMLAANNYVGSNLANLTNSGSLTADYPVYVAASSTLGSLTNSGTLNGSFAAIYNAGTLGVIANSGVIAGNINNTSAQAITLTGGAGSTVGTLTGFGGGRGTISSTGGNVVFASGAMLLNDDIVATGHTVSNTGAGLTLANSASITGAYSQTAGALNLATGQQLIVSGAASITGGTVTTSVSSAGNYLAGSTAGTLVQGGAGSSYAGASVSTGATPGLSLSAATSGDNLVVTAGNNYVGASLASVTNSGSLTTDYPVYVASTGSLGGLTNSGTLSGSIAAVYNAGTIGAIANTGLIAGDIVNLSAQALTFTGGTGATIGALTGLAGGIGTITNTGGDVVFASGNLVLNDNIVATGHTVSNTGANLSLISNLSITGGYSQSAGTLNLIPGTSSLIVSGTVNFTGGTVSTSLPTVANYLAGGGAGTLIQGGAGSSYSGVALSIATSPGLALTASVSGNDLVMTAVNNYVGTDLANLTNSDSLTADYPVYVASTSDLGGLTNSGTLSGSIAALYNAGTIGTIANTGVIAGDIVNLSAQALTFTGGTGATIGTLTGFGGSRGTITNNAGDVVFASGNLVLDNDIVATGHTVSNIGAALTLQNSASVTGGYGQTAGALNLAPGQQLNVSGAASITGGTVSTTLAPAANYLAGSTAATLVQGGAGSNYAGASVTTGVTPGLSLSAATSGDSLVVTAGNNYVGGSLASLTNSGSLTNDYPVYVASTGSLGGMTNSGTLSGSIAAIYSEGSISSIANTGLIAGNIVNLSAQTLTITGGANSGANSGISAQSRFALGRSAVMVATAGANEGEVISSQALSAPSATGADFGTLTGFGGSRGTISNAGDVVFASGNLVLDDDVVVAGHTVSNTGAVLALQSSASITGGYRQTAGALNLAMGQQLNVSGAASITGGTVSTTLASAANYLAGSTAGTLVRGGAGSNYAGASVATGATPGLSLSAATSGDNLVVTAGNNYVGASLGSLTNSGTLTTDYPVYVASTGSLGGVTNSGTLSGSIAAVYNAGTIGAIANTGLIAGDIVNLSTADLRISGGSGASFGTLTGYAVSSQGAINNVFSNVVLTGNILLNDTLNLGANTLISNDATLQLTGATRVNGNYSQTGGMLLIGVTSKTTYGQLQVSGTASLTGATVKLVALGTGSISAGDAYTVVKATAGLSYSNLTASVTGLEGKFSSVTSDGATGLVLTVERAVQPIRFALIGAAAGGSAVGTGAALDLIADNPSAGPVVTDVLLPLAVLTPAAQQRGIMQLSPSQLTPQVMSLAASPVLNAIARHQDAMMAEADGANRAGQKGPVWGQFLFNASKRVPAPATTSYDAINFGIVVGTDVVDTEHLMVGGALNWTKSLADGRAELAGSRTRINSVQASTYFSWQPGERGAPGLAVAGQLSAGYNAYNQHRQIDFLGQTADASFDGAQYLAQLRASYKVKVADNMSIAPYGSVRAVQLKNEGYTEQGAGAANLRVEKQTLNSLSHELGIQGVANFDTSLGRLAPSFKLGWVHNYNNGAIPLNASLGGIAFTSRSARVSRDGVVFDAGLDLVKSDSLTVGLQYEGELRDDFQSHSAVLQFRYRF